MSGRLLEVRGLTVTDRHGTRLVDDLSFSMDRTSRVGLIGESGSGKTLTALALMGLLPHGLRAEGRVLLDGVDLLTLDDRAMCTVRGNDISMVFQEPMTALNPLMRVGRQVAEALVLHGGHDRRQAHDTAVGLFAEVGIDQPEVRARAYPHELSGGQRQRVMIAMALACGPDLVVADEPTTALDATVQSQVLDVLGDRVGTARTALLLITHDLPVVAGATDDVLVLERGRLVERGHTADVFSRPAHPHTQALVAAIPPLSRGGAPHRRTDPVRGDLAVVATSVVKEFPLPRSAPFGPRPRLRALDEVSIEIHRGETHGIVGESGSGKTTLARLITGLDAPTSGTISHPGLDAAAAPGGDGAATSRVQMVFQDPMGSLDPRMRVGTIVAEPLRALRVEGDHRRRVRELLDAVGLPEGTEDRYPHEFSGGQRQRIAIARALAPRPSILVADEPVSALDMSVRTTTLDLLASLKDRLDLTIVFISHDLSVVHEVCDRVTVLHAGRIVEQGATADVFARPSTPYTARLIAAIPRLEGP